MAIAKRIFLFMLVNIFVLVTISIVLNLLGVQPYLTARGLDPAALAVFCLVWGFGGALISLALSRVIAKMAMGVKVISPDSREPGTLWLREKVYELSRAAGLPKMPEVGIYDSPEVNAFATGPTKARALVAVSSGLLQRMDQKSVEGVLGHEVSHIANGDMVTMTLLQGVVNAFVMFFARIIAWSLAQSVDANKRHIVHFIAVIVLEIGLSFLGMIVVAYFSRHREFRADAGGSRLAGNDAMIQALRSLQRTTGLVQENQSAVAAFKISGRKHGGLLALLSTHPSLDARIQRLEARG